MSDVVKPRLVVVMGASGCGKTTIALGIHQEFGWAFQEGDDLHPPANVEKMAAGIPLTDEDRWPWLRLCHEWLKKQEHSGGVLTCSALKRSYRDLLREGLPGLTFVYLRVPEEELRARVARREHHYMPSSLVASQIATLEEPTAEEHPVIVDVGGNKAETLATVVRRLKEVGA